jgi:hypothetical protein
VQQGNTHSIHRKALFGILQMMTDAVMMTSDVVGRRMTGHFYCGGSAAWYF